MKIIKKYTVGSFSCELKYHIFFLIVIIIKAVPPQHALLNFAFAFIFSTKYQDLLKEDYDSKHYFTINKGGSIGGEYNSAHAFTNTK